MDEHEKFEVGDLVTTTFFSHHGCKGRIVVPVGHYDSSRESCGVAFFYDSVTALKINNFSTLSGIVEFHVTYLKRVSDMDKLLDLVGVGQWLPI